MQVQGDAFLARVFDNEDDFERLDFTLREVASSAPWVKEAAAQNEAKMRGDGAGGLLRRMQVESPPQFPCQQHPSCRLWHYEQYEQCASIRAVQHAFWLHLYGVDGMKWTKRTANAILLV